MYIIAYTYMYIYIYIKHIMNKRRKREINTAYLKILIYKPLINKCLTNKYK